MMNLMKRFLIAITVSMVSVGALAQEAAKPPATQPAKQETQKPAEDVDFISYLLGLNMGVALRQQAMPIKLQWLMNGIIDGFSNRSRLSQEQLQKAQKLHGQVIAQRNALMQRNKENAANYMAENKKKAGVVTTQSGLQYQVFEAGKGPRPGPKDKLTIKYAGRLTDGKEFLKAAQMSLTMDQVKVQGMRQALGLMNAGAKWQLTIPPELGYGASLSDNVPPHSVLVVDVEMISIEPNFQPPAPQSPPASQPSGS